MSKRTVAVFFLLAGCGASSPYGYTRTYEPLSIEESYAEQALPISYEEVRRDPEGHKAELLGWFGTVTSFQMQGSHATVALNQRFHQERHQCENEYQSSCRVTVVAREGGPFTAEFEIRPENTRGRDRIAPGSLLKVYGHVEDAFDDRGGPIMKVDYYRHFPAGTYVIAGGGGGMLR